MLRDSEPYKEESVAEHSWKKRYPDLVTRDDLYGGYTRRWDVSREVRWMPEDLSPQEVADLVETMRQESRIPGSRWVPHDAGVVERIGEYEYCPDETKETLAHMRAHLEVVDGLSVLAVRKRFVCLYGYRGAGAIDVLGTIETDNLHYPDVAARIPYPSFDDPTEGDATPGPKSGMGYVVYHGFVWETRLRFEMPNDRSYMQGLLLYNATPSQVIRMYEANGRPDLADFIDPDFPGFYFAGSNICESARGHQDGHYRSPYSRPISPLHWVLGSFQNYLKSTHGEPPLTYARGREFPAAVGSSARNTAFTRKLQQILEEKRGG